MLSLLICFFSAHGQTFSGSSSSSSSASQETPGPTATATPPFGAVFLKTSQDLIGPGPSSASGDGQADLQLEISGVAGTIRAIRIQGCNGDTWQWPNSGYYWNIARQTMSTSGVYRLNFAPSYPQNCFRATIQYDTNVMATALAPVDRTSPNCSCIPLAPKIILDLPPVTPTPTTATSFSATYQATTEDKIGAGPGAPTPDGSADRQVLLKNLKANPVGILIQGRNGDTWITPSNGSFWSILATKTTDGAKLNFAPSQSQTAYRVSIQYTDSTIDSTIAYVDSLKPDASGLPPAPTSAFTNSTTALFGATTTTTSTTSFSATYQLTSEDKIGPGPGAPTPDGSSDRQVLVRNAKAKPVGILIQGRNGDAWINPSNGSNWSISTAETSDGLKLNFAPYQSQVAYRVSFQYPDNTIDSTIAYVDPANPDASGLPTAPTRIVTTSSTAPAVSLTAPLTGSAFTAPATITLTANATDSDGTIARVEFFNGTTLVGSDTSAPFSFTWSNVAAGTYSVTAKATDNNGASATSSAVSLSVTAPNQAPTVSLSSSATGSTLTAPATIALTANASDADGTVARVDFFNGTTLVGSDTSAPFSFTWSNVAAGTYSVTAKATDNNGASATSSAVSLSVTAPNQPPSVILGAPTPGSTFLAPATIVMSADASDKDGTIAQVDFYNGGSLLGSVKSAPYTFTWTNVPAGTYSLSAKATDSGGAFVTSAATSISVTSSNKAPSVSLVSPSSGTAFSSPASITLNADASDSDGTVKKVDFFNGATLLGTDTTAPFSLTLNNVTPGTYSYSASATDNVDARTSSSVATVTVTSPTSASATIQYSYVSDGMSAPAPGFNLAYVGATSNVTGVTIKEVRAYLDKNLITTWPSSTYLSFYLSDPRGSYTFYGEATLSDGTIVKGQELRINGAPLPTRPTLPAPVVNPWNTDAMLKSSASQLDITLDSTRVIPASQRLFPQYTAPTSLYPSVTTFLSHSNSNPQGSAGGFDDIYYSGDRQHSNWGGGWNSPSLMNRYFSQIINANYSPRNFTSDSTVGQGHMSLMRGATSPEKNLFSYNWTLASPSYESFFDNNPEMSLDSYDAIFNHVFRSVGQSGSEISGIAKMTFAGASLPWSVKRKAKQTGNYGALVNHMYRIALPYADASGKRVPETNELLHRHSYLTVGTQQSRFATTNKWYHQYQDDRHWHDIFTLGRSMVGLPAVTVLRIKAFSRTRIADGVVVESGTGATGSSVILEETASLIRTWPKRDEVFRMTISLGESYDVNGLPLTYDIRPLYENQASAVTIQKLATAGEFSISFKYDPKLPRGRIPLIASANNGVFAGIPAFINAYYALDTQTVPGLLNYGSLDRPESVVQFNRRPQLVVDAPPSQLVAPGSTVSFKVTCTDPDGFPTKIYRWLGEPGTLSGDTFTVTVPSSYEGTSLPFHFICSDGTGAYSSAEVFLGVGKARTSGFTLVDVGTMNIKSTITERPDGSFTLASDSAGRGATTSVETSTGALNWGIDHGTFLAMPVSGDFDITARVDGVSSLTGPTYLHPSAELLFRKTLSPDSPGDAIGVQRNDPDGFITRACAGTARLDYGTSDWRPYMHGCSRQPTTQTPTWLRLIRRSEGVAYFLSTNGTEWEQAFSLPPESRTNRLGAGFAGLFFAGRNIAKYTATTPADNSTTGTVPAQFNGMVKSTTSNSLPLLFPASGKFGSDNDSRLFVAGGSTSNGAQVMAFAPAGSTGLTASYRQLTSFDDTATAPSPSVAIPTGEPIRIMGTGIYEIRARSTFTGGVLGEVVSLRLTVNP